MTRLHLGTALFTALLVGGGVLIGALVFGGSDEGKQTSLPAAEPARAPAVDTPPPMLGVPARTPGDGDLGTRVARLEAEVARLEATLKAERESVKPLLDLYERMEESGVSFDPEVHGELLGSPSLEVVGDAMGGSGLARQLATSIGLDAERADALAAEVGRLLTDVEELEKRHAEVTVENGVTTISIPRYEAEGGDVRRQWDDWVATHLTPEEQDQVRTGNVTGQLFGNRLGDFERTVSIREVGGNIKVDEQAIRADDEQIRQQMEGPAIAREFVLQDYMHLLD